MASALGSNKIMRLRNTGLYGIQNVLTYCFTKRTVDGMQYFVLNFNYNVLFLIREPNIAGIIILLKSELQSLRFFLHLGRFTKKLRHYFLPEPHSLDAAPQQSAKTEQKTS
jgi:hypothetical protein